MRAHDSIASVGSIVLTTALLFSPAQLAADVGNKGNSTTTDDLITGTARDSLVSVTALLNTTHTHTCIVTASAGTFFGGGPVGVGGRYIFDLTRTAAGTLFTAAATARTVDFVDQPLENDPNNRPVATNFTYSNLTGTQTFTFNARKATTGSPTLTVTESAISVNCQLSGGI
jgi:hypothetical protein